MFLNQRAFNLFTALIAFALIVLSVLLTQSMIQSERQTQDTIAGIESRSELRAVADMATADAIQVFNYGLRERIEAWLADRDTGRYTIALEDKTWKEVQQDYAQTKFGGEKSREFAVFAKTTLLGMFYSEENFGNYSISLENEQHLQEVLEAAIRKSIDTGRFFEVVECDMDAFKGDPSKCMSGTFYVSLAIADLPFELYEKLPRIRVRNKATGDEVKEIILPRANFRIFVPIRLFKALAESRAMAHTPLVKENSEQDNGVFSVTVHNQIEEMALGMCDRDYCHPRANPFTPPPSKVILRMACPGDNQLINQLRQVQVDCSSNSYFCSPLTYDPSNRTSIELALAQMVSEGLCQKAKEQKQKFLEKDSTFVLKQIENANCGSMNVRVNTGSDTSKVLDRTAPGSEYPTPVPGYLQGYNAVSCSRSNPGERVGLFRGADGKTAFPNITSSQAACSRIGTNLGQAGESYCSEVINSSVTLLFVEKNPIYKVNKNRELVFEIKLFDNRYTGFAPGVKGGNISQCYFNPIQLADLNSPGQQAGCSFGAGQGWSCITVLGVGELGQSEKEITCRAS